MEVDFRYLSRQFKKSDLIFISWLANQPSAWVVGVD
jgi:hypothetical protein